MEILIFVKIQSEIVLEAMKFFGFVRNIGLHLFKHRIIVPKADRILIQTEHIRYKDFMSFFNF